MEKQITIKESVTVQGDNVYNGNTNYVTFHPARDNHGIRYHYASRSIKASLDNAVFGGMAIALEDGLLQIKLVEHMQSAIKALGIDNLDIELSDGVCPTTDNCGKEYFEALQNRVHGNAPKKLLTFAGGLERTVYSPFGGPDSLTVSSAHQGFWVNYHALHPSKGLLNSARCRLQVTEENYKDQIMTARPPAPFNYDFSKWLFLKLGEWGAHGVNETNYFFTSRDLTGNWRNNGSNVKDRNGRTYDQNFADHKTLDVLGTLALVEGTFVNTAFNFDRSGHKFDIYALKTLMAEGAFKPYIPSESKNAPLMVQPESFEMPLPQDKPSSDAPVRYYQA